MRAWRSWNSHGLIASFSQPAALLPSTCPLILGRRVGRPRETPGNRRLTIIIHIHAQPTEGVPEVFRELHNAAVNHERSLRCVHDPANEVRVTKETHGFTLETRRVATLRRRRDG